MLKISLFLFPSINHPAHLVKLLCELTPINSTKVAQSPTEEGLSSDPVAKRHDAAGVPDATSGSDAEGTRHNVVPDNPEAAGWTDASSPSFL